MAIFRKINTDFWEDSKVVDDFTPEDKYFMMYLLTNPHTTQVGCYGLTIRQIEFETGYNKDTVLKLIKRFTENLDVILYDENTKEVLVKNWHKYNWTSSPKIMACILNECQNIKSSEFRNYINTLLIQYGYSIDSVSIQKHNKNKNKEEEEKEIFINNEKQTKISDPIVNPIVEKFTEEYKKNFNSKPFLNYEQKMKLIEIASDNPEFIDNIPPLMEKFKSIEFEFKDGKKKPGLTWLIDKGNWADVLNGKFDKQEQKEEIDGWSL